MYMYSMAQLLRQHTGASEGTTELPDVYPRQYKLKRRNAQQTQSQQCRRREGPFCPPTACLAATHEGGPQAMWCQRISAWGAEVKKGVEARRVGRGSRWQRAKCPGARPAGSSPARCSPADASPWSCRSPAREQALMPRGFTEQGLAIRRHVLDTPNLHDCSDIYLRHPPSSPLKLPFMRDPHPRDLEEKTYH